MTSGKRCCWAQEMLAEAVGAPPTVRGCASPNCGLGTCRRAPAEATCPRCHSDLDNGALQPLRETVQSGPDVERLTETILQRLDAEGLLPPPATDS